MSAGGLVGDEGGGFTFALAPSLGRDPVRTLARRFADLLYEAGFRTVVPAASYERLEQALLDGEVDAAWGPPLVCARVERAGGTVLLRALRLGAATYRSVLLCRVEEDIDLTRLGRTSGGYRAAWVDAWSMGGYVLPRHYLKSRGIDLDRALVEEQFLGSYQACFQAVLDREADLTASFAGPDPSDRRGLGYVELCGYRSVELKRLAYTEATPNDAIVLSPALEDGRRAALVHVLRKLVADPDARGLLIRTFDMEGFDEPPAGTYQGLLSLL